MKTSAELKAERLEMESKVLSIVEMAKVEARDLNAEEIAEVDSIQGSGDKPGKLLEIDAKIERAERLEALQRQKVAAQVESRFSNDGQAMPTRVNAGGKYAHLTKLKAFAGNSDAAYEAGQFIRATIGQSDSAKRWCNSNGIEIKMAMGESDNTKGGFLVPIQFETAIITLLEEYGVFRANCYQLPMSAEGATRPRRDGGLTAYFVGESGEITASDAALGQVSLTNKKLATLTRISTELSEDSAASIADIVAREIAYAFAVKEDGCGFLGDGTSTYGGVVGLANALAAGSIYDTITGNTAFSTLDIDDFEAMVGKLPAYPGIQPKWYVSKAGWAASMLRLKMASGGATPMDYSTGSNTPEFLGYPVVFAQGLNSTLTAQTSTKILYFGDLMMSSTMGVRRGMTIASDSSRYFEYDQIAIRGTERFDIVNHEVGTASAAGPMLVMKTASS